MGQIWKEGKIMSSGQYKRHDGFNQKQIKNNLIVLLRKDGSIKSAWDRKTGELVSVDKFGNKL